MKTFLSKYLPLILSVLSVVGSAFVPAIHNFWAAHPTLSTILTTVGLFFPQPHGK